MTNEQKRDDVVAVYFDLLESGVPAKSDFHRKNFVRSLASAFYYDGPKNFSGLESVAYREARENKTAKKPCPEHYNGRTGGAETFFNSYYEKANDGITSCEIRQELADVTDKSCEYHHVTSKENRLLFKYQKMGLPWQEAYAAVGIVLIPAPKKTENVYHYNTLSDNTLKGIAYQIGISPTTAGKWVKKNKISVEVREVS